MESGKIMAIIGYILAILLPLIGVIYGLILFFAKGDDEYVKKHAKYIIIVGVVMIIISLIIFSVLGISMLSMAAMS